MKKCRVCNTEFDSRIEYCFLDGERLGNVEKPTLSKIQSVHVSNVPDPSDVMQTLDNISIHDLLQIGGHNTFQGFGEFTPMQAPKSKDGDTLTMSRTEVQKMVEAESAKATNAPEQNPKMDFEDIMDDFGTDLGAHLDDTLDGVQVGRVLPSSSLSMGTNEILPGDTLDVKVDDLDVPEMQEADLGIVHTKRTANDFADLDSWDNSGAVMREAVRQAHSQRKSAVDSGDGAVASVPPTTNSSNKMPMFAGLALLLLALGGWAFTRDGGEATVSEPVQLPKKTILAPKLPIQEKVEIDPEAGEAEDVEAEDIEPNEVEVEPEAIVEPQDKEVEEVPAPKNQPKNTGSTSPTQPKPVQNPLQNPEVKAPLPQKPHSLSPKIMPQKERPVEKPVEPQPVQTANLWDDAGEKCELTVKSNVPAAILFVDGIKKGRIGVVYEDIDCGAHKIEVRAEGFSAQTKTVNLSASSQNLEVVNFQ